MGIVSLTPLWMKFLNTITFGESVDLPAAVFYLRGCIGEENNHCLCDRLAFTVHVALGNIGKNKKKSYEIECCALTG